MNPDFIILNALKDALGHLLNSSNLPDTRLLRLDLQRAIAIQSERAVGNDSRPEPMPCPRPRVYERRSA